MTTEPTTESPSRPPPELAGQTVVIDGSARIGLATVRLARGQGAELVLAARNPERLEQAGREIGARGTVAFDALDAAALEWFFAELPVDHLGFAGGGSPSLGGFVAAAGADIDGGQHLVS